MDNTIRKTTTMTNNDSEPSFYACHKDWKSHSGYAPTVLGNVSFRPVSHHMNLTAQCQFCGETTTGVFQYREVKT